MGIFCIFLIKSFRRLHEEEEEENEKKHMVRSISFSNKYPATAKSVLNAPEVNDAEQNRSLTLVKQDSKLQTSKYM